MPPRSLLPLLAASTLAAIGVAITVLHERPLPASTMRAETVAALPPEAAVTWDVRDAATGLPISCKIVFAGVDGTPTPRFTVDDIGVQMDGAVAAHDRLLAAAGEGAARVPLGTYDVFVSHGPEWTMATLARLAVGPSGARIAARLARVVDTSGWVSGDFHVHAAMSSDSHVPMRDRVYEFLAAGVEVIASTDHNAVSDYAPIIAEMGRGDDIRSVPGDELTTDGWGHFGAFPLPVRFGAAGQGAMPVLDRDAAAIFAEVRARAPGAIIDVHHPREAGIGYFSSSGFDAAHDRAPRPGFSLDFDAVEVLNGYQEANRHALDAVLGDWFQLLLHGHLVTAMGNSDTHHLDGNVGGYPRNFLRVGDDRPASQSPQSLADAIRGHRVLFTTGPFVRLRVGETDLGGVADATSGHADVSVEVQAAPWVSVSQVVLYQSGREVRRFAVSPTESVVRLRETVRLPVAADGFVVARVEGDRSLAPVVGVPGTFDVWPLAVTNPVFLDHDGNGVYDAPLARR